MCVLKNALELYFFVVNLNSLLAGQVLLDVANSEVLESSFAGLRESSLLGDGLEEWLLGGSDVLEELELEVGDILWLDLVEVTSHTAEDASDLLSNVHWGMKNSCQACCFRLEKYLQSSNMLTRCTGSA